VQGLDADLKLQSRDPGPCDYFIPPARNVNRQIVSTRNGLQHGSREYAIKLRSDTLLEGCPPLDALASHPQRIPRYRVFESRIVACTLGTMNPRRGGCFFHLSDFFFLGRRDDLLRLFDIPLAGASPGAVGVSPVVTEQYILLAALRRAGFRVKITGRFWRDARYWRMWEMVLANNFVLAHPTDLGLLLPRKLYRSPTAAYEDREWGHLYHLFCVPRPWPWLAYRHYYFRLFLDSLRLP
jgi:hypothetical protein